MVPPVPRSSKRLKERVDSAEGRIVATQSLGDLPDVVQNQVREKLARSGGPNAARGTVHQGKVYVVADELGSVAEIDALIAHEVTHAGLRGEFGQALPDLLDQLYQELGDDGVKRLAKRYGVQLHRYELMYQGDPDAVKRARLADELLAQIAESDVKTQASLARRILKRLGELFTRVAHPGMRRADVAMDQRVGNILRSAHQWYYTSQFPFGDPVQQLDENNQVAQLFYGKDVPLSLPRIRPSVKAWLGGVTHPARRKVRQAYKAGFGRRASLGDTAIDLVDRLNGDTALVTDAAMDHVRGLEADVKRLKIPRAQLPTLYREINKALAGENADIPTSLKPRIKKMRKHLDAYSRKVADIIAQRIDDISARLSDDDWARWSEYQESRGQYGDVPSALIKSVNLYSKILDNRGEYLHRSYAAYSDPNHKEETMTNRPLVERAIGEIATLRQAQYREKLDPQRANQSAAITERNRRRQADFDAWVADTTHVPTETLPKFDELRQSLAHDTIEADISAMLEKARRTTDSVSFVSSGSKPGSKDLSTLMQRKDIPPILRELLGEYKDARINFARSAEQMGSLITNDTFLRAMKSNLIGKHIHYRQIKHDGVMYDARFSSPGSESYSPLDGLYGTEDMVRELERMMAPEARGELLSAYMQLNGMVKVGKTVYNPATHFANFGSSGIISFNHGHLTNVGALKRARALMRSDRSGSRFELTPERQRLRGELERLIQLGVLRDGGHYGEAQKLLEDVKKTDRVSAQAFGPLSAVADWAQNLYGWGDDLFKATGYFHEYDRAVKSGMVHEDAEIHAAKLIRDIYPTYSKVPEGVKMLRANIFMGNFVSFSAERIRNIGNEGVHFHTQYKTDRKEFYRHLAHRAIGSAFIPMLALISRLAYDVDDEEDGAMRQALPEWSEFGALVHLGQDKDGNYGYIDFSRFNPDAHYYRMVRTLLVEDGSTPAQRLKHFVSETVAPFTGFEITFGSISDVLYNSRDRQGGVDVFNPEKPADGIAMDIFKHLATDLSPGFVNAGIRFGQSLTGDAPVNRYGKQLKTGDEILANFGFRKSTLNLPYALSFKASEFGRRKRDADGILRRFVANQRELSDEEIEATFNDTLAARTRIYKSLSKMTQGMMDLGLPPQMANTVLKDSGVSAKDRAALLNGEVPRWSLTDTFTKNATNKALWQIGIPNADNEADLSRVVEQSRQRVRLLRELEATQ